MSRFRIGPAGFSYQDWKGVVYPPHPTRGFDPLRWIARFFDLVEVNASFYRIPSGRSAARWLARVADRSDFVFTAKVHRSLTHEPAPAPEMAVRQMRDFVEPLREARRLGPLLAQFPWSFRPGAASLERLLHLRDQFEGLQLVFELRHGDWMRSEHLEQLRRHGLDCVSIDQPQVGNSLPPSSMPGQVAYVRLHGRNERSWFARDAGRDQRYDYLYSENELRGWVDRLREMASRSATVHVVTNNHFRGKAVVNALELKALLDLPIEEMPRWLLDEYPELRDRLQRLGARPRAVDDTDDASASPQGNLFD